MRSPSHREHLERAARHALATRRIGHTPLVELERRDSSALYEQRTPEIEDRASNVTAAQALETLGDQHRRELAAIDAALVRLDGGTWGRCLQCGHEISEERLRAVPEAVACARCMPAHIVG